MEARQETSRRAMVGVKTLGAGRTPSPPNRARDTAEPEAQHTEARGASCSDFSRGQNTDFK